MAMAQVLRRVRMPAELGDIVWAGVSGVIDGVLASEITGDVGSWIWFFKSLGIPIAGAFGVRMPKGLLLHSTGQLGMMLTLIILGLAGGGE